MKIVFLAPFGIRPKGTVIARMLPLAEEMQRLGHQVVIIAPPYTNPEDSGKVEVLRGVTLKNVSLGPSQKILAVPFLAWRMFAAALAEKPDLVHLFKPKGYGGVAAMLHIALDRLGLRLPPLFLDTDDWEGAGGMNELHGYSGAEKRFYSFQERWLSTRAIGVTVASRALYELTAAMGVPPSRLLYLPNCVAASKQGEGASVRERFGIPKDAPVVLLYTRFFEFPQEKLHWLLARIYNEIPEVRYLVVGQGRSGEEKALLTAMREQNLAEYLCLAGWVEPEHLADFLAAGDVAIYPFADNLLNRTKCPAKLTELMLAGRPVVADRVGQLAEYVEDGRSGILCDTDDWESMAVQVAALLRDADRRRDLGQAGRERLLTEFNWSVAARRLVAFYLGTASPVPPA